MPEPLHVPLDGATLAGERLRGAGPFVVLLHAGVCDRRSFAELAELLCAQGCCVVAYDRRGFGETPPSGDDFRHLDDLLALLDAVAGGRPAWLVGSSMGGALALDAALAAPERVAGLVLVAPAVSGQPEPDLETLDPDTRRAGAAVEAAFERGDLDEANRAMVHLWLDGPAQPEGRVAGPTRELALDMDRIVLAAGDEEDVGGSGLDTWSRLAEVGVPVTLLWGDLDVPFGIETCRVLAQQLPDVRATHVVEGTAHLPYLERPEEVAAIVAQAVGAA